MRTDRSARRLMTVLLPRWLALAVLVHAPALSAPARPGPFVFVHGLQGPDAAATVESLGCNALYYELPLDAPDHLEDARPAIEEGATQGLSVIVGLPTKLAEMRRISARDADYCAAVRDWVDAVVTGLRGTPGIAAWATDHYLERDINYSDADFRGFLLDRYGSLADVNASWGTQYARIDEVTREGAREVDQSQVYGVGRASVDLADYERDAFRDIMSMWAETVRAADPDTPLMTGRVSLYRSLTAIPDTYDVVQLHLPPDIVEPDLMTHNVQAVEMARRGGRFEVIPWLRVPVPPSQAYSQAALCRWIMEAGLRGAVGVCLEDWERISSQLPVLNNTVAGLEAAIAQGAFSSDAPTPCAAVIYEPYAGGHQFAGTPGYGYLTDYAVNDLAEIAYGYRFGSAFGGLDYLCLDDLGAADLSRYSLILAPACLSLPPATTAALSAYVEAGGVLFTDLGAGMYEARSWDPSAGPLAALLGITGATDPADRFGGFRVGQELPALPSVRVGMSAGGSFVPGQGQSMASGQTNRYSFHGPASQMRGYAFQGPSWFVSLSTGAAPLATEGVRFDDDKTPYFMGLSAASIGPGLALFAPFACFSYWPPDDPLHTAVMGDLMARRARYRLASGGLVGSDVGLSASADSVHLLSRGGMKAAQVLAEAADHRLYLGATCTFSAGARDAAGRRTGAVLLDVEITPGGMAHCDAMPIRMRPETGEARARVSVYAPGLIMLDVGGTGARWGRERRDGPVGFYAGQPTRVRVSIDDGDYPVAPGSRHSVVLQEGRNQPQTQTVTADHRGRLDFWLTVTGGQVTVGTAG